MTRSGSSVRLGAVVRAARPADSSPPRSRWAVGIAGSMPLGSLELGHDAPDQHRRGARRRCVRASLCPGGSDESQVASVTGGRPKYYSRMKRVPRRHCPNRPVRTEARC
jgi:hypothetical protein